MGRPRFLELLVFALDLGKSLLELGDFLFEALVEGRDVLDLFLKSFAFPLLA